MRRLVQNQNRDYGGASKMPILIKGDVPGKMALRTVCQAMEVLRHSTPSAPGSAFAKTLRYVVASGPASLPHESP